jgi:hypothetical protein
MCRLLYHFHVWTADTINSFEFLYTERFIISLPQFTARHRPLQSLAISLDLRYSHPAPASSPAQIVTPPGLMASYTTFTRSPLQNSFTPVVIGSTADMDSPLPLQHANTVKYGVLCGDFSSLPDHLVSNSTPQRNPERSSFHSSLSDLKLVDQPCLECPRLGTVYRKIKLRLCFGKINFASNINTNLGPRRHLSATKRHDAGEIACATSLKLIYWIDFKLYSTVIVLFTVSMSIVCMKIPLRRHIIIIITSKSLTAVCPSVSINGFWCIFLNI